jgi:N-acyl-L-homoserine lactone synthetase
MRYVTFGFLGQHRHGTAFHRYLRLRKRYFVDVLGWDIPHDDDVEMDQYDNPCAHYVLVLRDSAVIGGARMMPTTASWGRYSYMLRDALMGEIDIPPHAVSEEIVSREVWECSRLVISADLGAQAERTECLSLILCGCEDVLRQHGGSEVVSLSPLPMLRTLRQLGYSARRVGDPYWETDGRKYAMLRTPALTPALTPAHSIAAE